MGPVLSCARTTEEGNSDRCALFKAVCGCCRWCYLTTGQEAETEERLSEAKLNVVSSVGLRRASSGDVFAGEAKSSEPSFIPRRRRFTLATSSPSECRRWRRRGGLTHRAGGEGGGGKGNVESIELSQLSTSSGGGWRRRCAEEEERDTMTTKGGKEHQRPRLRRTKRVSVAEETVVRRASSWSASRVAVGRRWEEEHPIKARRTRGPVSAESAELLRRYSQGREETLTETEAGEAGTSGRKRWWRGRGRAGEAMRSSSDPCGATKKKGSASDVFGLKKVRKAPVLMSEGRGSSEEEDEGGHAPYFVDVEQMMSDQKKLLMQLRDVILLQQEVMSCQKEVEQAQQQVAQQQQDLIQQQGNLLERQEEVLRMQEEILTGRMGKQ